MRSTLTALDDTHQGHCRRVLDLFADLHNILPAQGVLQQQNGQEPPARGIGILLRNVRS
jgi:hypothetical protein